MSESHPDIRSPWRNRGRTLPPSDQTWRWDTGPAPTRRHVLHSPWHCSSRAEWRKPSPNLWEVRRAPLSWSHSDCCQDVLLRGVCSPLSAHGPSRRQPGHDPAGPAWNIRRRTRCWWRCRSESQNASGRLTPISWSVVGWWRWRRWPCWTCHWFGLRSVAHYFPPSPPSHCSRHEQCSSSRSVRTEERNHFHSTTAKTPRTRVTRNSWLFRINKNWCSFYDVLAPLNC